MSFEAEFWVLVATVLFVLLLGYVGVHKSIASSLDARRIRIQAELDEASRLKEEAQKLVAHYQRKQQEAVEEAALLVASARDEAERYVAEAHAKMDDFITRRTAMAETKITQAEAQALADVRAAAADVASGAAALLLAQNTAGKVGEDLVTRSIADVKAKLN